MISTILSNFNGYIVISNDCIMTDFITIRLIWRLVSKKIESKYVMRLLKELFTRSPLFYYSRPDN